MDSVVPGHGGNVRPCEYFDIMGGSGPSGLACLLFAKFSLTVNEVIEYLENLSRRLDDVERLTKTGKPVDVEQYEWDRCEQRYRNPAERLEGWRQLVMDYTWLDVINSNFNDWLDRLPYMNGDEFDFKLPPVETGVARAKAAVISSESPGTNGGTSAGRQYNVPILHRTYECRYAAAKYTFYAVGLGTFGAPEIAKPGVIFSDFLATGRHTVHNPTRLLLEECSRLWPGMKIGTVISIGTGNFDSSPKSWNFDTHPLSFNTTFACSNICRENQKIASEIQKYVLPFDAMLRCAYHRFDLPVPMPFFEYAVRPKILSETRLWMKTNEPASECRSAGSALQADSFPIHDGYQVALSCLASLFEDFISSGYYQEGRVMSDTIANMMIYEEASGEAHLNRMVSIALDAERLSWIVRHKKPLSYSEKLKLAMLEVPIEGLVLNCFLARGSYHSALSTEVFNERSRLSDIAAGAFCLIRRLSDGELESRNSGILKSISRQLSALVGVKPSLTETVQHMKLLIQITSLAALCEACTIEGLRGYKRMLYNGSFIRHLHSTVSIVSLDSISDRILAPIADVVALSIQLNNWSFFRDDTVTKLLSGRMPNSTYFWSFVNLALLRIEVGAKSLNLNYQSNSLNDSTNVLLACERMLSQASTLMKEKLLEVIVLSAKNGYPALLRKCLLEEPLEVFPGPPVPSPLASTLIDRTTDDRGENLMHVAARGGFTEVLKSVAECLGMQVAKEVINRPNNLGQTPFHLACMGRASLRFFDLCWKLDPQVKAKCKLGRTPLHYCFPEQEKFPEYYSGLEEVIESHGLPTVFPHGADGDTLNRKERGLDFRADEISRIIVVLLQHRADINLQDLDGLTPVHLAVKERWGRILARIFDGFRGGQYRTAAGDCLTLKDNDGFLALDLSRKFNDHEGERIILDLLSARGRRTGEFSPRIRLPREHMPSDTDEVLNEIGRLDERKESYSELLTPRNSMTLVSPLQNLEKSFQDPVDCLTENSSPSQSVREGSLSSDKSSPQPIAVQRDSVVQRVTQSTNDPIARGRLYLERHSDGSASPKIETSFVPDSHNLSRSVESNRLSRGPNIEEGDFVEELDVLGPEMVPAWSDLSNVNKLCSWCKSTMKLMDDESTLPIDDSDSETGSTYIWNENDSPTVGQIRATAHHGCHFCTLLLTRWIDVRRNLRLGAEHVGCGWNRKVQDKIYANDQVHLRVVRSRKGNSKYLSGGVRLWCAKGDRLEESLLHNIGFWELKSRRRAYKSNHPGPDCMEYGHELAMFRFDIIQGKQTNSSMWHPEKYGINPPINETAPITVKDGRYVLVESKNDTDPIDQKKKPKVFESILSTRQKVNVHDTAEDIAKYWLKDCATNHACLNETQDWPLPTRVINVENTPFLVQSNGGRGRYATLSYQWGQCRLLKTTSETLKAHHNSIPMDQMPKTFKDVIKLVRTLGLRYLWIDSLCILQDSVEDCQRELDSMPDIYANSTITIAAVGSLTADSGCPLNRNKLAMIDLRISDNIVIERQAQDQYNLLERGSIHDRAWCYQEIQISPRLLICGANEIFWQCKKGHRRESDPMNLMLYQPPDLDRSENESIFEDTALWSPEARILDQTVIPNSEHGYHQWYPILRAYSELRLTFSDDKLRALSAMAKRFATLVDGPLDPTNYVCGLWRADLPKGLLWKSESGTQGPRPRFRAPSWSWAAYDTIVKNEFMQPFNRLSSAFCSDIVDVSVEPVSYLNYFGAIKYAKLTIHGPLAGVPEEIYGTYEDEFAQFTETGIGLYARQMYPINDKHSDPDNLPFSDIREEPALRDRLEGQDDSDESGYERPVQYRRSSDGSRNNSEKWKTRSTSNGSDSSGSSEEGSRENPWFLERGLISWDIDVVPELGHKVLRMTDEFGILLCPVPKPGCPGIFQRIGIISIRSFSSKRKAKLRKRFDAFNWKDEVVTII